MVIDEDLNGPQIEDVSIFALSQCFNELFALLSLHVQLRQVELLKLSGLRCSLLGSDEEVSTDVINITPDRCRHHAVDFTLIAQVSPLMFRPDVWLALVEQRVSSLVNASFKEGFCCRQRIPDSLNQRVKHQLGGVHEAIVFHIFHEQACKDYIMSPVVIFFILFVASAAFLFIAAREYILAQRLFSHWLNT